MVSSCAPIASSDCPIAACGDSFQESMRRCRSASEIMGFFPLLAAIGFDGRRAAVYPRGKRCTTIVVAALSRDPQQDALLRRIWAGTTKDDRP
jgi:hypothetical protein